MNEELEPIDREIEYTINNFHIKSFKLYRYEKRLSKKLKEQDLDPENINLSNQMDTKYT